MVELQILNKVIQEKSDDILVKNNLTEEYFYEYSEEYKFIIEHKNEFGCFPDKETVLSNFPETFEILVVNESDEYLVSTIKEEYVYRLSLPILNTLAEKIQTDSYDAIDYLKSHIEDLDVPTRITGIDIISGAKDRLEEYKHVSDDSEAYFIPTGFEELDDIVGGWHRGEELVVLFARTGQGKSWIVIKMIEHCWKMNNAVTLVEPEMSANKTGYRFDTLYKHISNKALLRGEEVAGYEQYINSLSDKNIPIRVLHPKDFQRKVTVSKLRSFCVSTDTKMLVIDGITYLTDERKEKGDNRTTQLTHISEDLMDLSIDLGIPVLVVCQANREGAKEEDLQLENIRDSDGIAYNASVVISIMQKDPGLVMTLNKSRNSMVGVKLTYLWDIDTGMFSYIPSGDDDMYDDSEQAENLRSQYKDKQVEEY